MTIPQQLIDRAATEIYRANMFGDEYAIPAWHDKPDTDPVKNTTRNLARVALETVAADIWDEGFIRGSLASETDALLHETREIDLNPHERIEHA